MTQVKFPIEVEGEIRVYRGNGEIEIYKSKNTEDVELDDELDEDIKLLMFIKRVQQTFANTPLFLCGKGNELGEK